MLHAIHTEKPLFEEMLFYKAKIESILMYHSQLAYLLRGLIKKKFCVVYYEDCRREKRYHFKQSIQQHYKRCLG